MWDSAKVSNHFLQPGAMIDRFTIGDFKEMESRDTLMKLVQKCDWKRNDDYVCDRFYYPFISNAMPVAFYERFLNYLKEVGKRGNYFVKYESTRRLTSLTDILIKRYESGRLS